MGAVSGVVLTKVHVAPTGGGNWLVHAQNAAVSSEDPGINFIDPTTVATMTIASGSTQNLFHVALTGPIGEQLNFFLTTAGATGATITISVDLIIRDA